MCQLAKRVNRFNSGSKRLCGIVEVMVVCRPSSEKKAPGLVKFKFLENETLKMTLFFMNTREKARFARLPLDFCALRVRAMSGVR